MQARTERQASGSVLASLLAVAHQLENRLETALARTGLSLAKLGVLRALAEVKEPMALSQLAERNQCVRSNITQLVDRLEVDGLVRRVDDASDRRIVRAVLTPAGRRSYTQGAEIVDAMEREVAGVLSPVDAAALGRAVGRLGQ
jgi:DNA-binding MarR family transcriptional regulator